MQVLDCTASASVRLNGDCSPLLICCYVEAVWRIKRPWRAAWIACRAVWPCRRPVAMTGRPRRRNLSPVAPCARCGADAARDLAQDGAGAECTLAGVVGGGHVAPGQEHEQVAPAAGDAAGELTSRACGRRCYEQPAEAAVEVGAIPGERGVLQAIAPRGNGQSAAIRDPNFRPGAAEEAVHHGPGAAFGDDVANGGRGEQHPLPPAASLDPSRGLVGGRDRALAHGGGDPLGRCGQRRLDGSEHVGQRALADREPEHFLEQPCRRPGQMPRWRCTRVTIGRIGGRSMWSQACTSGWSAAVSACAQCRQALASTSTTQSGAGQSARRLPGRPLRFGLPRGVRFGPAPREGG